MTIYTVSVIIPTLDRGNIALATLNAFKHQTFIDFELLIIDQTTPPDNQLLNFKANVYDYKYYHVSEKSLPNARNVAAEKAHGSILIFVDDDVNPEPNLVSNYLDEFRKYNDSVWVIGGKVYETGSKVMSERTNISGGYITNYGKTLKNFSSDSYAECEWVVGCNFAVRRDKFLELGGFDKNFIGNAMLEDGDFCFLVREYGGRVIFSPKPQLEHLRAKSGGTRQSNPDSSMYYRSHNTVYFFRKHNKLLYLPLVFFYLNSVALKNLLQGKHSIKAFVYTLKGYIDGFFTKLPE